MRSIILALFALFATTAAAQSQGLPPTFWSGSLIVESRTAQCATLGNGFIAVGLSLSSLVHPRLAVPANGPDTYVVIHSPRAFMTSLKITNGNLANAAYAGTTVFIDGFTRTNTGAFQNVVFTPAFNAAQKSILFTASITNFLGVTGCTIGVRNVGLKTTTP